MSFFNFGSSFGEQQANPNQLYLSPEGSNYMNRAGIFDKNFMPEKILKQQHDKDIGEEAEDEHQPNGLDNASRIGHRLNMMKAEQKDTSNFSSCSSENLIEFDRWAKKFRDLVAFHGKKWDENDKLAKLRICLDGTPMRILDSLDANQKDTMDKALKNVRQFLDSPQRRELTYQALANCRQKETETVQEFLNRFTPLIEATTVNFTDDAKQEIFCRAFLEKVRPDIGYMVKSTTLGRKRDIDTLCVQAQEAEIMLAGNSREQVQFTQISSTNPQDHWSPNNIFNNNFESNSPRGLNTYRRQQYQPHNYRQQNDWNWNSKPICNHCNRVGHIASDCFFRNDNNNQHQVEHVQAMDSNAMQMLHDLAAQVHELRLNSSSSSAQNISQHQINCAKVESKMPKAERKLKEAAAIQDNHPNKISSWEAQCGSPTPKSHMIGQRQHQASIWTISHTSTRKHTSFGNVPIEKKLDPAMMDLTLNECKRIVQTKQCEFGVLVNDSGLWETQNKVELSPKVLFFVLFSWKIMKNINCYAFKAINESHYGENSIFNPAGANKICAYQQGHCTVLDQTVIYGEPKPKAFCRFRQIGNRNGRRMDGVRLSDDGQLGLTTSKRQNVTEYSRTFFISDQGFVFRTIQNGTIVTTILADEWVSQKIILEKATGKWHKIGITILRIIIIIVCVLHVAVRLAIFQEASVGKGRLGRLIPGQFIKRTARAVRQTIATIPLEEISAETRRYTQGNPEHEQFQFLMQRQQQFLVRF